MYKDLGFFVKIFSFILFCCLFFYVSLWWGCSASNSERERISSESPGDEVGSDEDEDDSQTRRRRRRSSSSNSGGGSGGSGGNNNDNSGGNDDDDGGNNEDENGGDGNGGGNNDGNGGGNNDGNGGGNNDNHCGSEGCGRCYDTEAGCGVVESVCSIRRLPENQRRCNTYFWDDRAEVRGEDCRGNLMYLCGCLDSRVRSECNRTIPDWLCDSDDYSQAGDIEIRSNGEVIVHRGAFVRGTWEGPGEWKNGRFQCSIWEARGGTFNGFFRDSIWRGTSEDWIRGCIEEDGRETYNPMHRPDRCSGRRCSCP